MADPHPNGVHASTLAGPAPHDSSPAPPAGPPPPTYAPTHPQILLVPLPDASSFFWGRTIQGEVYVKGLGESRTRTVASLTVSARLRDRAPGHPTQDVCPIPEQTLYPPQTPQASSSGSAGFAGPDHPFPTSHRFALPLPPALPDGSGLPGSLDLGVSGQVLWLLEVRLALIGGEVVTETVRIEGVPPEIDMGHEDEAAETCATKDQDGVRVRLVLACARPRLGDALRIGVEVQPKVRQRTGVAGLSSQPDPMDTLRKLRRVRVELVRLVEVESPEPSTSGSRHTVTTVIHSSGKSLRYPGSGAHPPLRLLFSLPTAQTNPNALATGGEVSARTPYHTVRFAVRATLGFGLSHDLPPGAGPSTSSDGEFRAEQDITIRPRLWREPHAVVIQGGMSPAHGICGDDYLEPPSDEDTEEAREAYRRKGRDVVGARGTTRMHERDAPPPFGTDGAGPSGTHSEDQAGEPPSFNESEEQMRTGHAPYPEQSIPSERLVPVSFEEHPDPPRRPSLTGELATWIEYDGYETFSVAPPPAEASFGVQGSMDPPQDGEENIVGDMVARLAHFGPPPSMSPVAHPAELMEQLGLGHGTRVVDLQDDMPPGIDEPSLPGLPGFGSPRQFHQQQFVDPFTGGEVVDHPPSFAASEAAEAVGGVARSRVGSIRVHNPPMPPMMEGMGTEQADAPPEYFGGSAGGPPAYGS